MTDDRDPGRIIVGGGGGGVAVSTEDGATDRFVRGEICMCVCVCVKGIIATRVCTGQKSLSTKASPVGFLNRGPEGHEL